ncbi:MAG: BatA and WFA domain-containing protein [Planctomycetales bacterium]|nr:BatA and WFA domain-containing protein [Planctomycetales bacterium]
MTFASPVMLWSLLALAPLVAVYFLKVRPRTRSTTAYFLWEKIFHEKRSTALWQRLRNVLSLLMMALAFCALALAMAEPRLQEQDPRDLLILIDNSASMHADEGGATRLDLAKDRARDLARGLNGVQRAAVATVAGRVRYQSHLTDNPRELLAAIQRIEPTYETLNPTALPTVPAADPPAEDSPDADKGADWRSKRRVVLVSDVAPTGTAVPEGVELLQVGTRRDNLGLVGADLRFVPGSTDRLSFYYQLASTHQKKVEVDLVLSSIDESGEEHLAKVIPQEVEPGLNPPEVVSVENAAPGRWVARLDAADALAADNTAWLVARRPAPVKVSMLSDDSYFLQRSIQAFGGVVGSLQLVSEDPDVVLALGAAPAEGSSIVFHPQGDSPWWGEVGEEILVGAPRVLVENHPLLRHLDPLSINFYGARRLTAPRGSEVLVAADDGTPLLYLASRPTGKAVVVNLDPVAAEFYYSAWFPVLVHASALHLAGRESELAAVYSPGERVAFPAPQGHKLATLTDPAGNRSQASDGEIDELPKPGFYEIAAGDQHWTVACGLLSTVETLLNAEAYVDGQSSLAAAGRPSAWLVVLALIVVAAESLLYLRRKVG